MKAIATTKAPAALGPYTQAFEHNGMLFASGQIGINPETKEFAPTVEEQAEQACKNVAAILEEAGYTFDNVIKTTCFLANIADFPKFNEVYGKYFTSKPARSCVAAKDIPAGALCEIEITAVK